MPNDYFQFKQFTVRQNLAAMKVGTDGVLLGAWASLDDAKEVLDVGTGTGLIALMMAQRNPDIEITAIDIDALSVEQAHGNATASPWPERIKVLHNSFQDFARRAEQQYDLIVTNPPFFTNLPKASDSLRTVARHTVSLSIEDLLDGMKQSLKRDGRFALILPFAGYECFQKLASGAGFFEERRLVVYPTLTKPASRILSVWSFKQKGEFLVEELVIEPYGRHQYSKEYMSLTNEFYLNKKQI